MVPARPDRMLARITKFIRLLCVLAIRPIRMGGVAMGANRSEGRPIRVDAMRTGSIRLWCRVSRRCQLVPVNGQREGGPKYQSDNCGNQKHLT